MGEQERCSSPELHHFKALLPRTKCDWCGATVLTVATGPGFKLGAFVKSYWSVLKEVNGL